MPESDVCGEVLKAALAVADADSIDEVLERVAVCVVQHLTGSQCTVWWRDKTRNGFTPRFAYGPSSLPKFPAAFIAYEAARDTGILDCSSTREAESGSSSSTRELEGCQLAPLCYDGQTNGILAIRRSEPNSWSEADRAFLTSAAAAASGACCHLEQLAKRTQLSDILHKISEATYDDPITEIALVDCKALVECDRAVLRRINPADGALEVEKASPRPTKGFSLPAGEGITGLALKIGKPCRVDDVTDEQWRDLYRPLWPGSRSELAVPILLPRARARVGTGFESVDKPFGVLNFESPGVTAFSSFDEECTVAAAQHMARVLERIEFDKKLERLTKIEQKIASFRDWESIAEKLMEVIRDTLGFEYVSFHIVNREAGVVRCTHVIGIEDAEGFKRAAVHNLDGPNIQADIVRTRQIEVPAPDDHRLDSEINKRFNLGRLTRVFLPLLAPSRNEVLGTVSAGYDRNRRPHIYDRDVQILKRFVDFAAVPMEVGRRGIITRASHEMNAPLSAIRNNVSWLLRRRRSRSEQHTDRVLEDIATDAEILRYQVQQLEYVLAGRAEPSIKRPLRTEPVLLFRDVIIKTINQLKTMVRDKGLDPDRVTYDLADVYKIKTVHVDKTKISQVIFNLFVNAVKYAESPQTFQIRIGAEERANSYVISISDWGVGVPAGLEEKIFEEWFRAPDVRREVSGSGLGLTIARQLMREHGGDVLLRNRTKPTRFEVIIPKKLPEDI